MDSVKVNPIFYTRDPFVIIVDVTEFSDWYGESYM